MPKTTPKSAKDDDISRRLQHWRLGRGLIQAEAARILQVSRGYYSQVEQGKRPPGMKMRIRVEKIEKQASNVENGRHPLRNIPVLSWARAGEPAAFEQIPNDWEDFVPSDVVDDKAFGVRLRGDSMEPKFSDGDIAILLPSTAPTNGEIVVANIKDQGVLCKIMHVQLDKKLVKLSSYNPAYPPTEYHRDEFNWIFPVASVVKLLRRR